MINSVLMLGSNTKKNRKMNIMFAMLWLGYMLLNANFKTGLNFVVANIIVFGIVFAIGQVIKGKYTNTVVSILSILIWSVLIDIICYFMFPQFVVGQNIITYVWNGILFNYKHIFTNALALGVVNCVEFIVKKGLRNLKIGKVERTNLVVSSVN